MIHLDCARRISAISLAAILILSASGDLAFARKGGHVPVPTPRPSLLLSGIGDYGVDATPRLKVLKVTEPPKRQAGVKVKTVGELLDKLKNEAGFF